MSGTRYLHLSDPKVDTSRDTEMRYLYVEVGLSLQEVGDRVGFSRQAVARHLRARGVKILERGGRSHRKQMLPNDVIAHTIYLYHDCQLSYAKVGKILGISEYTVRDRIKRYSTPRTFSEASKIRHQTEKVA
jgi:biotin operon repressor